MRDNRNDRTIERNYTQKWRFLISEYLLVKAKRHPKFRFLHDFYAFHHVNRQTFAKYYNRYLDSGGDPGALLPAKRGPRWRTRRTLPFIEQLVPRPPAQGQQPLRNLRYPQAHARRPYAEAHHHLRHLRAPRPQPVDSSYAAVQTPDHRDARRGVGASRLPLPPDRGERAAALHRVRAGFLHASGMGGGGGRSAEFERDVRGVQGDQRAERGVRVLGPRRSRFACRASPAAGAGRRYRLNYAPNRPAPENR